jgi:hypothetical protein
VLYEPEGGRTLERGRQRGWFRCVVYGEDSRKRLNVDGRDHSNEEHGQQRNAGVLVRRVAVVRHQQRDHRNCDCGNCDPQPYPLWMEGVHSAW